MREFTLDLEYIQDGFEYTNIITPETLASPPPNVGEPVLVNGKEYLVEGVIHDNQGRWFASIAETTED